jgi:drug/metabolite transporter (DMT)-like permease
MTGIGYLFGAYFLYAVSDAAAKWLVGSVPVWEVLFLKSWLGLALCLAVGRRDALEALALIPRRRELLTLNIANFAAWGAFYSAAANLPLPQLYAIYYLSPIMAALLAGPMLGEKIRPSSWLAAGLGFTGVLVTTGLLDAGAPPSLWPTALALAAALMWALTSILYRRNVHGASNMQFVVYSNVAIGIFSAPAAAWTHQGGGAQDGLVLLVVTAAGVAAHFLLMSGVRRVSVALAGPIGFSSLLWSALLGYLVWGDVPQPRLLAGGVLILAAALIVVRSVWRSSEEGDAR